MATLQHAIHPGVMVEEWRNGLNLTVQEMAKHLGVTRQTLSRIVHGRQGVTADMALRLSEALNTSPLVWLNLQQRYDLAQAAKRRRKKIPLLHAAAA
jgi:addiction module HigA family antidote